MAYGQNLSCYIAHKVLLIYQNTAMPIHVHIVYCTFTTGTFCKTENVHCKAVQRKGYLESMTAICS